MKRASAMALVMVISGIAGGPRAGYAEIHGHYGFSFTGVVNTAAFKGPIVGEGDFFCNKNGDLTGDETFNVAGTVCTGNLQGTFTVHNDAGTVTAGFTPTTPGCPSGTLHLSYTAVDNDKNFLFVQTDSDKVVSGEAERK
jgi:hypothetical protein